MPNQYRVKIWETPDAWMDLFFECEAADWNDAAAQALRAYPLGMIQAIYLYS